MSDVNFKAGDQLYFYCAVCIPLKMKFLSAHSSSGLRKRTWLLPTRKLLAHQEKRKKKKKRRVKIACIQVSL